MTPERFIELWVDGGPSQRESFCKDVRALLQGERERLADIVRLKSQLALDLELLAQELESVPFPKQEDAHTD